MVFIGQLFFENPKNARAVTSRSLDAIQTLGAIQRAKVVRFKVQDEPDHIYSLCLDQAFPGFRPIQLSDFRLDVVGQLPQKKRVIKKTIIENAFNLSTQSIETSINDGDNYEGRQNLREKMFY